MVFTMDINNKVEKFNKIADVEISKKNSTDYDHDITMEDEMTKLKNNNSMENTFMSPENLSFDSENEETYDAFYSCFMCNVSYDTQFDLDAHLRTHVDDEIFHHSNINSMSKPLPRSSIKPSKLFRCNECFDIFKSHMSYNEHMLTHKVEKPHHCRECDRKFRSIDNFQTHLKSHENVRTLFCFLCQKTINGEKNYFTHFMNIHNDMCIRTPRPFYIRPSLYDSDEDYNPKIPYPKKKKIVSRKFKKDNVPFGPLFVKKAWEKKQQELDNVNLNVEEKKSERDETIESSRQDVQNMLEERKEQLTDYNTEEYQQFLKTLILEKNTTGQINAAKLIGPSFWKNELIKAGLIEEEILPMQFQSQLKLTQCTSCRKCFARLPKNTEVVSASEPPCSICFMLKNESTLNKHKTENHTAFPPYVCKECSSESDSWYMYVQHMKMHSIYATKCSECIYIMINKPNQVMFLCHVCDSSFDSDEQLKVHVLTHFEN